MASMNMKIHGVVSVEAKPIKSFDGLFKPVYYRTIIAKNADGTEFEIDLFGDTAETLHITEAT